MALGAITTPTPNQDFVAANKRFKFRDVVLSAGANYTTGGETITPAAVGLRRIVGVLPLGSAQTTSGTTSRVVSYKYQTDGSVKQLVHTTGSAEAASNSDQSTFTQRALFIGF